MALTTTQQVQATYLSINRVPLDEASATAVAAAIDGGTTTFTIYRAGLIAQAATTTTAAFALSTFIEGVVPTSARIDSLTAFAKTQLDYYTNTLKSGNAQLGAFEALGKAFAADATTSANFAARYSALSATDFVTTAYASIFDASPVPTTAALANLVAQVNYFTSTYTAAGIPAADAALQAKGAVLGQIIGYAVTGPDASGGAADPSIFDQRIEDAISLAAFEARAEITPSTVYGVATLGETIDLTAGALGVSPSGPRVSTQFGDKISGTLGTNGFTAAIAIDGGLGVDSLTVTTNGSDYAPAADIIKSIEKLTIITTTTDAKTVALANFKGLTDFTLGGGSLKTVIVTGLDVATTLHVTSADVFGADMTVGYGTAPAAAKVSIDADYFGTIDFSDSAVKSVTANVTVASSGVNFADNDLTSVTVTSKGNVTLGTVGTGLKTLDLSGVGTYVKGGITDVLANAATVTLSKGADAFSIIASKGHMIALGASADAVTIVQQAAGNVDATSNDTVTKTVLTVTDFSKTDGDILRLDAANATRVAFDATQLGQIAGATDLKAAATAAGAVAIFTPGDDWSVFNFGGSAYALYDVGNNGFNSGDTLIKLTGLAVADLTFGTNFFAD
jgi:hypothetical protein